MRPSIIFTIFWKELTESLRDRMTLIVVVALPMLVYPLMITGIGKLQRSQAADDDRRTSRVAVWGQAPVELLDWLRRSNTVTLESGLGLPEALRPKLASTATPQPTQPPAQPHGPTTKPQSKTNAPPEFEKPFLLAARDVITRRETDAVLVLWPGLDDAITRHGLGSISVYHDSVRPASKKAQQRLEDSLELFRTKLIERREQERGLAIGFSSALDVRLENVAPPARRAGHAFGFILPFVLIMLSATGALYASIDLTAGEKDRATMQTLLCAPVHPLEIVAGKFLAVWCISLVAALANTVSLGLTFSRVTADLGGISVSPMTLLTALPCLLPVTCTVAALFLAVAVLARDAKDAGNFLSATLMILLMPMGITLAPGVELSPATAFVPLVNIALLIRSIFVGEATADLTFLTLLAAAIHAMLALLFAARVFNREQILLGGKGAIRSILTPSHALGQPPTPGLALAFFAFILVGVFYGSLGLQKLGLIPAILISQYGFFLLPVVLLAVWMKFPLRETFSLRRPRWQSLVGCVLLSCSAAVAVAGITMRLLPAPESLVEGMRKILLLGDTPAPLWLVWLVIGLTPALCEETVFRGLMLGGLRRLGMTRAIVISALLFGLAHSSIYRLLPTFALGLIFGYAVWRTGSIFCSILIHALNNGLIATAVYFDPIANRLDLEHLTMVPWSWTIIAATVAALGLWLLRPLADVSPSPPR